MLAEDQKWGVQIDNTKNAVVGYNSELLKPESLAIGGNRNSKARRFYWYKPFGCALPKALLYEITVCQKSKVQKVKSRYWSG